MTKQQIDLGTLTGGGKVRNLSGHDKGVAARQKFQLTELDLTDDPIEILVPDYMYAVSSSFVQGMFAESLSALGSRDAFFNHYRFNANSSMIRQIERGLAASRMHA
jgi:hypothetical protein